MFLSSLLFLSASPPSPPIWNCRLFRELRAGQEPAQTCGRHQRQETLRDRRRSHPSLPASGASSANNCSITFKSASFSRRFNSEGVRSASVAGCEKSGFPKRSVRVPPVSTLKTSGSDRSIEFLCYRRCGGSLAPICPGISCFHWRSTSSKPLVLFVELFNMI